MKPCVRLHVSSDKRLSSLEMMISGIFSEAEQKVKLVLGVQKEVKMLTDNLQSVQAVFIDAEKRQLKEETVKLWLQRLKNISYDIDDVLDEWSTEILKSKIEGDEYEYVLKHKRNKVWSFVLSFCFCFREVGFRHDIAVKIKELNESLDVIAREKDRYMSPALKGNENVERAMTSSVVTVTEVRRREDDENAVLNLLLAESVELNSKKRRENLGIIFHIFHMRGLHPLYTHTNPFYTRRN